MPAVAQLNSKVWRPTLPTGMGGVTQISPKGALQAELGNGLPSSRVAAAFAVHAGLVLHRRLSSFSWQWVLQAHAKLGSSPRLVLVLYRKAGRR